jgi:hypothetical protein
LQFFNKSVSKFDNLLLKIVLVFLVSFSTGNLSLTSPYHLILFIKNSSFCWVLLINEFIVSWFFILENNSIALISKILALLDTQVTVHSLNSGFCIFFSFGRDSNFHVSSRPKISGDFKVHTFNEILL